MPKKSPVAKTLEEIKDLEQQGFSPLTVISPVVTTFTTTSSNVRKQSALITGSDELALGPFAKKITSKGILEPQNTRIAEVPDDVGGTPGLKPIKWGIRNILPALIYKAFKSLPYTAAGQEYMTNAVTGLGVDFRYQTLEVSDNGAIREIDIPYKFAGIYIKHKIAKLRAAAAAAASDGEPSGEGSVPDVSPIGTGEPNQPASPNDPIKALEQEYEKWERVNKELQEFIANNNLAAIDNNLAQDDLALDLYFRAFGIELATEDKKKDPNWHPKILHVGSYPAVICRLEEYDENGDSRYTYMSERWRYELNNYRQQGTVFDYKVVPNIDQLHPHKSLKDRLKTDSNSSWFIMPYKHLSTEQRYYSVPACWSLFPSLTFLYASTLMYDKAAARQNSTMWGKIIYISDEYLEKLYSQSENGHDPEEQKKIRDNLIKKINNFLKERENNGTTVALESFIGPDGKTPQDSIRIVDVPAPTKSTTEAEINSMSSCINAALNLDSRLVGSVPGAQTSSSGTQARELELLETKKLSTRKQQYKHFYRFIIEWNDWDPEHLEPVMKEMVLTTLDASKEGLKEISN